MRIDFKKRYLIFLLSVFAVFSASIGLSKNNYLSSHNEKTNSKINSTLNASNPSPKSIGDDIQVSASSTEEFNSSDLDFPQDALKLTGIIISNENPISLVTFNNISGIIIEKDMGGSTTSLLPDNVILEEIDISKSRILLRYGERKFVQYLYPQNTLEINS